MPGNPGPIKSIKNPSEAVYKEKGSVFKAQCFPVSNEEESVLILKNTRKLYYDAVHHCYAWKLKNHLFKYSDDGEPSGTAGIRIMNAIDHHNLTDILCIVTRWFGGTKLGVGPLGKAYYKAADDAVISAEFITLRPYKSYKVAVPYEYSSLLFHIYEKFEVIIQNTSYSEYPEYDSLFPLETENEIISELSENSMNNIQITNNGIILFL